MFTDKPPPKVMVRVFEAAAGAKRNPPPLDRGADATVRGSNTKPPVDALVVAGVDDAPNVNGRLAGFESFLASAAAPDEAAPNVESSAAAPKLTTAFDIGASALASAAGSGTKGEGLRFALRSFVVFLRSGRTKSERLRCGRLFAFSRIIIRQQLPLNAKKRSRCRQSRLLVYFWLIRWLTFRLLRCKRERRRTCRFSRGFWPGSTERKRCRGIRL